MLCFSNDSQITVITSAKEDMFYLRRVSHFFYYELLALTNVDF